MHNPIDKQILYLGRWVDRAGFRTFVYNMTDKLLAKSYDDYCKLIESGIWYAEKPAHIPVVKTHSEVTEITNGKRGKKWASHQKV